MVNAGLHAPDAIILDLEDSVHSGEKDAARLLVRNALRTLDFGPAETMVRINQLPLGLEDLEAVIPESPDLILVPKVESPDQVLEIAAASVAIAGRSGGRVPWMMPILESAIGIERAFEIASASSRVVALTIGLEDYTADLGVVKTSSGDESAFARARVVNAAKAAGVQAIDSVYGDVADLDGLAAWVARSRQLGFEGMGCVHPRQIRVLHEGYAPSRQEIDRALKIEQAFREAEERGLGVVSLGSKMIDAPVVQRARRLVEQARAMGLVSDEQGQKR
jgi:citrate lyase subunit beta/citryl-CoA lyase